MICVPAAPSLHHSLQGATALLEVLLEMAELAAQSWALRASWVDDVLRAREVRGSQAAAAAAAAAAAVADARAPLLLAFGGATYAQLHFVSAGGGESGGQ
jgi:hypothetical protein